MTTKEQERQAIAKIRRIVEGLGENSYVGTAMEGVLEIAEQNIEYDAAFSLKGEVEVAEKQQKEATQENEKLKKLLEEERKIANNLRAQLTKAQSIANRMAMPIQMYEELIAILNEKKEEEENGIREAADRMADSIGEGGRFSEDAADAAREYREQRRKKAICENLLNILRRQRQEGEGNERTENRRK